MVSVTCAMSNITTPLYVVDLKVIGIYPRMTVINRHGYRAIDSDTLCQFLHRLAMPVAVLLPLCHLR